MLKRLFGMIFLALMLLSATIVNAEEAKETHLPDTVFETAVQYLNGINIAVDFTDEEEISRGQFVALAVKLLKSETVCPEEFKVFDDVDVNSEYANEIYTAYQLKMISGVYGEFHPEAPITVMESIKILLGAMGYSERAILQGGYPSGYIMQAKRSGLSKAVNSDYNATLCGRTAAVLLGQALITDMVVKTGFGSNYTYTQTKGVNILTEIYGLRKIEGIITATVASSLTSETYKSEKGHIDIEGVSYIYKNDFVDMLGYRVTGYIKKDEPDVLSFMLLQKNQDITILARDVLKFENRILYLDEKAKKKQYKMDKSMNVLYNGKSYSEYIDSDFVFPSGNIKILDNNNDGIYDVVFITDINYMKLTTVDDLKRIFTGLSVERGVVDSDQEDSYFNYYKWDGKELLEVKFSEVNTTSVIGYAVSKDGLRGMIVECAETVSGILEEIGDDYVIIDGNEYYKSAHFEHFYGEPLGMKGKFIISPYGELVEAVESGDGEYVYGYLINVARKSAFDSYKVKLLDKDGSIKIFGVGKNCLIDGRSYAKTDGMSEFLIDVSGEVKRQLIKYLLSENEEIVSIDTAVAFTDFGAEEFKPNDNLVCFAKNVSSRVKAGTYYFNKFILNSGAKVFVVPPLDSQEITDADFLLTGVSYFKNDFPYTLDVYDLNSMGMPTVAVCYGSTTVEVDDYSAIGVVERVVECSDEEAENIQNKKIYLWTDDGMFKSFFISNDVSITKEDGNTISAGDVVRIAVFNNRVINSMSVEFDASVMEFTVNGNGRVFGEAGYSRMVSYSLVSIYKKFGNNCYVSDIKAGDKYDYSLDKLKPMNLDKAKCLLVNRDTGTLKPILLNELYDYYVSGDMATEMFVRQRYWDCLTVVAYVGGNTK